MLSNDELKEIRAGAEITVREGVFPAEPRAVAYVMLTLIDELERVRKIHRIEQRRSADRLREALNESA